jgi:methanogenic corrinoid protein MtbC1
MADLRRLSDFDDTPVYTIKTVVQFTGISPATLRAWERRYGVLAPSRTDSGYRLYSERDMATLLWLKGQVDAGVAISRAVALLEIHHRAGEEPELTVPFDRTRGQPAGISASGVRSREAVSSELLAVLLAFREAEAGALLSEAFALYPVEIVVEEIIAPVLVEIGDLWNAGEATITQEHFATAFLRRRLTVLFHAYDEPSSGPLAIAGSAPSEWHDVGILMVALTLRRHGWQVIYLGQNVPVEHLTQEISRLHPDLVCLSATMRESAVQLVPVAAAISRLPEPQPRLAIGGRAFNVYAELRDLFPGAHLAGSARELVEILSRR